MASLLVVDDDQDGRWVLCEFLSRKGYQVTGVPSGRAAQASLVRRVPDLVILDLCMPGMDGCGLLRVMQYDMGLYALPVVVLTGFPDGPAAERARDMNVNAVLTKGNATLTDIHRTIDAKLGRTPEQRAARRTASVNLPGAA